VLPIDEFGDQLNEVEATEYDFIPNRPLLPGMESATVTGRSGSSRPLKRPGAATSGLTFLQWHTSAFEIIAADDHAEIMSFRPLGPARTAVRLLGLVHEGAEDYDPEELSELQRVKRLQDDRLCELVERGVTSTAFEPGPFNTYYELSNRVFVRVYLDAIA